jgi:hypothetical protein
VRSTGSLLSESQCYLKGNLVGEPMAKPGITSGYLHTMHGVRSVGAHCPADTPRDELQFIADVFTNATGARKMLVPQPVPPIVMHSDGYGL